MNCPLADKGCGGCRDIDKRYGDLLKAKNEASRRLFPEAEPIVGAENPRGYRNKVLRSFANGKSSLYHGIYRSGTHQIVSVRRCLIEDERANEIANIALVLLEKRGLPAYREDFHKGVLRHMQVRRATRGGQILVTVITGSEDFPGGMEFGQELMARCPDVKGVIHNINPRGDSAVMGYRSHVLAGRDEIWDTLGGLRVCLTSRSFYQVNTAQAEKLYTRAIGWANLSPADHVLDAYCGVGVIGLLAAKQAGHVTGIEIIPDAIACAKKAAKANQIENIEFICGDAGQALNGKALMPDVVLMDPPRAGCSEAFLSQVIQASPGRIVYISCNPETLKRDVERLQKAGYRLERVQPYDLFPYTKHVETVCLLTHNV